MKIVRGTSCFPTIRICYLLPNRILRRIPFLINTFARLLDGAVDLGIVIDVLGIDEDGNPIHDMCVSVDTSITHNSHGPSALSEQMGPYLEAGVGREAARTLELWYTAQRCT